MQKRAAAFIVATVTILAAALWHYSPARAQEYRTISWGASGGDVCEAQAILSRWGYYGGIVDCYFGGETSAAVRLFQRRNGLNPDGVVGPDTWAALGITVSAPAAPPPPAAGGGGGGGGGGNGGGRGFNVDMLARLIRAEAESEPYEGKVAVAAVLLNRVNDSRFPHTLEGVIYEPDAFESVSNGRIYATPPTDEDYRAARDAINGWDPTYGAVFFWNPYKPVSAWIWSRPIITQIGDHVFAR